MHEPIRWNHLAETPLPRAGAAVSIVGEQLVVAGGTYWVDGIKYWTDQVDALNLRTQTWHRLPSLPARRGDTVAVVQGTRLLLLGGGDQDAAMTSVLAWESSGWTEQPALSLPEPRRSAMAAVIGEEIFVLGGLTAKGTDFHTATGTLWSAAPGRPFRARAPLPAPVRFGAAFGALCGRLLVAGGCAPENGAVRNLDEILAYDPARDRWQVVGRLPQPLRGAWGLVAGDRMLVVGGYAADFLREILAVDAQGAVTTVGTLPVALADARFVHHRGVLYGLTGEDGVKRRFPGCLAAELPDFR